MKVFVYATLLDNKVLAEALQGHRVAEHNALLEGYEEVFQGEWPTLKIGRAHV